MLMKLTVGQNNLSYCLREMQSFDDKGPFFVIFFKLCLNLDFYISFFSIWPAGHLFARLLQDNQM